MLSFSIYISASASFWFSIQSGDQPNPAPAGQVDYTKAWEEYYKKMGTFYISSWIKKSDFCGLLLRSFVSSDLYFSRNSKALKIVML